VESLNLYDDNNPPDAKNKRGQVVAEEPIPVVKPSVAVPQSVVSSTPQPVSADEGKFAQMVRTTMKNSKDGTLSPVMQNMLKSNQKKYGVDDLRAEQILDVIKCELFGSSCLKEYQEMFEAFFEDGEIDESERALLIERQFELELTDEQVQSIESSIISARG